MTSLICPCRGRRLQRLGLLRCRHRRRGSRGGAWRLRRRGPVNPDTAARLGRQTNCGPGCHDRNKPSLPTSREPLLRIPTKHPGAPKQTRRADHQQSHKIKTGLSRSVSRYAGLKRFYRISPREKSRDVQRPFREARQRHRNPAHDQHGQEDALPQRLNGGHVVGHRRDHQAQAEKRESHKSECQPELERMPG